MPNKQIKYPSLAMRLRWEIKEETPTPGARLPSTRELADKHGVARKTVVKAMKVLAAEGLVEIVPGKGCYIAGGPPRNTGKEHLEWHLMNNIRRGAQIPGISELMKTCDVGEATVRRVIDEMTQQARLRRIGGLLYRT